MCVVYKMDRVLLGVSAASSWPVAWLVARASWALRGAPDMGVSNWCHWAA